MRGDSVSPGSVDRHLTEDELNQYLDDQLSATERSDADAHLSTCESCQATLTDLSIIVAMMAEIPSAPVPRSFQLGPEFARQPKTSWSRLANVLLPMLPVMRAGTIALALALGGVTAYRVVQDPPDSSFQRAADDDTVDQALYQATDSFADATNTVADRESDTVPPISVATNATTAQKASGDQPTEAADGTGGLVPNDQPEFDEVPATTSEANAPEPGDASGGSDDVQPLEMVETEAANTADESSAAGETGQASDSLPAPADTTAMQAAEPTATNSPTATATVEPTVTSTSTAVPTAVPASPTADTAVLGSTVNSDDNSWLSGLQVALGVLLAGLGAAVIGLTRYGRKQAS
jgi:hypothetical protein